MKAGNVLLGQEPWLSSKRLLGCDEDIDSIGSAILGVGTQYIQGSLWRRGGAGASSAKEEAWGPR